MHDCTSQVTVVDKGKARKITKKRYDVLHRVGNFNSLNQLAAKWTNLRLTL